MRVHVPILLALERELALLARGRHLARLHAHADLPRVPAGRHPGLLQGLGRLRSSGSASWSTPGVMEDYTWLWYDVRPHPNFGTVEIRAMDAQTHVEHTLRAGRAHPGHGQRARRALRRRQAARRVSVRDARREQVARVGGTRLEGELVDLPRGTRCPRRRSRKRLCDRLREHAQDLGAADELEGITDLLEHGNGALPAAQGVRGEPRLQRAVCRTSWRPRRRSHELASSRTRGRRRLGCPS